MEPLLALCPSNLDFFSRQKQLPGPKPPYTTRSKLVTAGAQIPSCLVVQTSGSPWWCSTVHTAVHTDRRHPVLTKTAIFFIRRSCCPTHCVVFLVAGAVHGTTYTGRCHLSTISAPPSETTKTASVSTFISWPSLINDCFSLCGPCGSRMLLRSIKIVDWLIDWLIDWGLGHTEWSKRPLKSRVLSLSPQKIILPRNKDVYNSILTLYPQVMPCLYPPDKPEKNRLSRAVVGFWKVVRPCRAEGISCGVFRDLPEKKLDSPVSSESLWAYDKMSVLQVSSN